MNALSVITPPKLETVAAEVCVLGAMLARPEVIDALADTLPAEDFYDPFLGHVYGLIIREYSLGRALNPVTLHPLVKDQEGYQQLGGMAWLGQLTAEPMHLIGARDAARSISEFAQRRRIVEGLTDAIGAANDMDQPVQAVVDLAETAIATAVEPNDTRSEASAAECVRSMLSRYDEPIRGVTCGNIPSIDRLLGPLRPSNLIIGAGRPGMGKTATAVSYALGAAQQGHGVLFFSLEMSKEELAERMAADLCLEQRVPYSGIRERNLTRDQLRALNEAAKQLDAMPLQIIDKGGLSIGQIRSRVRRWARRMEARGHKLELVIVDYLQLVRGFKGENRYETVSEVSRSLKEIAKDHELCVMALSQLSREVEKRNDKRPMLADLRESGQIEQDADGVLFFLRDEYYLRQAEPPEGHADRPGWEQAMRECMGKIEFILAKYRHGTTGSLLGNFHYVYQAVRG